MVDLTIPHDILKRPLLPSILKLLPREEIILLTGSRQAGKTYFLYMILKHLQDKVDSKQCFFFDLESLRDFELLESFKNPADFVDYVKLKGALLTKKIYVFIDEVQYLSYPSRFLKYLYDHYKFNLKLIVSGSSTLEIKKKFSDRLTGRVFRFDIHPLSFEEFLIFKEKKELLEGLSDVRFSKTLEEGISNKKIKLFGYLDEDYLRFFEEFVLFGGYPKVVLAADQKIKEKLLNEIYSFYVRKDIRDIEKITDVVSFNNLVKLLAFQIGSLVNENEISQSAISSRTTIRRYLFLLENTFVIHKVLPFFKNKRQEIIKMPKVYFEDTGLRNSAISDFTDLGRRQDAGFLVENSIFTQLIKNESERFTIHFWRTERKNEVDFILLGDKEEMIPMEVKYANFLKNIVPSNLTLFIRKYQPKKAVVITKNFFSQINSGKTIVFFIPVWMI